MPSDPDPHCQIFWHHLVVSYSLSCFFFFMFSFLLMFSFSLLLLFLLSLVQQVPSCSFLCFLCLTGSSFESIPVPLGCSFGICSISNQCLSHLKLRCSQNCLEGLFFPIVTKQLSILLPFLKIYSPAVYHSRDDLIDSECQENKDRKNIARWRK